MSKAVLPCLLLIAALGAAEPAQYPVAGADERTPSKAQYFSWINNTNEGSNEAQTLANLAFFRWLHDEYGMQLDIYAWDAGQIDGPRTYGTTDSPTFRQKFPRGWKPMAEAAAAMGCRLGLWGGPDGFGTTEAEAQARIAMMSGLCRDYGLALFKFDSVCTNLRPTHQDHFIAMMEACRRYSPDLILLNHRLDLGKGTAQATTSLWEGNETYVDVWMTNRGTATHHRAGALDRGLPPGLTRLTEDHGVCLSSCMDGWEDDLILQAFNRALLLAPQIYGNPWLLADAEYPRLARIFNLHRRYRDLLRDGHVLPEAVYGPHAVSRGDAGTRLITLRNPGWTPRTYHVTLDPALGLTAPGPVELRRFHPGERVLGSFSSGTTVPVEVPPFSACLLLATTSACAEIGVVGADAEVIRDVPGQPALLALRGLPGTRAEVSLAPGRRGPAKIHGQAAPKLAQGHSVTVAFPGTPLQLPVHRRLADLMPVPVPTDAEALYEATCFAADNDALEVRSLRRAGPTALPAVQAARDAFLGQDLLRTRGCWDRYLFDGEAVRQPFAGNGQQVSGEDFLRLDLGRLQRIDRLTIQLHGGSSTAPSEVSTDLGTWEPASTTQTDLTITITPPAGQPFRYLRMPRRSLVVAAISGESGGTPVDRTAWRCSNLFPAYASSPAKAAWSTTVTLPEVAPNSVLCIALEGDHGEEGAWVAARSGGRLLGCPDRAPSFRSNVWEYRTATAKGNSTFYLPVDANLVGQPIEITALTLGRGRNDYRPVVWITSRDPWVLIPLELSAER